MAMYRWRRLWVSGRNQQGQNRDVVRLTRFFVEHEVKSLLYMFFGGTTAIIVWKCA